MGVEPLIALPPRVLVAGRLQCGAARAGVRRGHGECAELAHLARGYKASYLRLDMLKTGRYLVRLGKIRFSHSARMNYQRVLRGSLAVPMRHHLTTVPLARQGTDGVAAGKLFLGRDRGVTFSASSTGERGLAGPTPSTSGKTIFLVLNDTDPYLHPEGDV